MKIIKSVEKKQTLREFLSNLTNRDFIKFIGNYCENIDCIDCINELMITEQIYKKTGTTINDIMI